jgi:hypothetical protein
MDTQESPLAVNIIYLRRTLDWEKANLDNIHALNREVDLIHGRMTLRGNAYQNIAKWQKEFKIDWFHFRHRLKQISRRNLNQIKNVQFYNRRDLDKISAIKENFSVIGIEDDDWLSPYVFDVAGPLANDYSGVVWTHHRLESAKLEPYIPGVEKNGMCFKAYTNNCLLNRLGFHRLKTPVNMEWHYRVDADFMMDDLKVISGSLSIANKTPASVSFLCWATWDQVVKEVKSRKRLTLPEDLSWGQEYADETWDLMEAL